MTVMAKREAFETYGLERRPYASDREADACTCVRCQPRRPRLIYNTSTFDPATTAALKRADARLAPFRTDALRFGG
jgi:hypothetical protein